MRSTLKCNFRRCRSFTTWSCITYINSCSCSSSVTYGHISCIFYFTSILSKQSYSIFSGSYSCIYNFRCSCSSLCIRIYTDCIVASYCISYSYSCCICWNICISLKKQTDYSITCIWIVLIIQCRSCTIKSSIIKINSHSISFNCSYITSLKNSCILHIICNPVLWFSS